MDRIQHTCYALNRTFTVSEWREYTREHPDSGNEVVFSCFGFDYNIHNVCLNPIVFISEETSLFSLEITVAKTPDGQWSYGFFVSTGSSSFIAGVHYKTGNSGYKTKEDAAKASYKNLLARDLSGVKPLKSFIESLLMESRQLTLF